VTLNGMACDQQQLASIRPKRSENLRMLHASVGIMRQLCVQAYMRDV